MLNLDIFSKAGHSSWALYKPLDTLFDCGEGFTLLSGQQFSMKRIFISHDHLDHTMGLPSLLKNRNYGKGDNSKPLEVYHPEGRLRDIIGFINQIFPERERKFKLNFIPLAPGDEVPLGKNKSIKAFRTIHNNFLSLGYVVTEKRSCLRDEYKGWDIAQLIRDGLEPKDLSTYYFSKTLAYTLDAYDFDWANVAGSEYLIADCTFINKEDRRPNAKNHYGFWEVHELAVQNQIKNLIAAHISERYSFEHVSEVVGKFSGLKVSIVNNQKINHF